MEQNTLVNRKYVIVTKFRTYFSFIFTILNTYVSWKLHAKIQPKISSDSGEDVYFVVCAILATAAILDIRPDPNFTVLRHWSQFMLHVKFENCRSSSFIVDDV